MNFKKLLLIIVPLAVLIIGYQYMHRVDRSDPAKVANAFAKAIKAGDTDKAGTYFAPAGLEAWNGSVAAMKSGAAERFRERVPADPQFGAPVQAKGVTTIASATDKGYVLEMQQIDGKWYVSGAPR